jgi:hypothetical protein
MGAIGSISGVSGASATAAVARLTAPALVPPQAQITPVTPVVPHKSPPAGLLAFDPSAPMVDLSGQPVEQIRALHQYRTSLQLLVGDGDGDSDGSQVNASA